MSGILVAHHSRANSPVKGALPSHFVSPPTPKRVSSKSLIGLSHTTPRRQHPTDDKDGSITARAQTSPARGKGDQARKEIALQSNIDHGSPGKRRSGLREKAISSTTERNKLHYLTLEECLRSIPPTEPWHPSIINFDELLLTPQYLFLVMPYYEHAMQVCVALPTCRNYFEKLASGVDWLHRHFITHNDIKLVNTVIRVSEEDWDGTPVIVDFGFATMHHPWRGTNFVTTAAWGTPEYLSPERVSGRPHDERLSDIWSLGVTFFEIATGRTPFERHDEQFITEEAKDEYYRRVAANEWIVDEYTPWLVEDLCRCMLEQDPLQRVRLQDIVQHEFFSPHQSSVSRPSETNESHAACLALGQEMDTSFCSPFDDEEEKSRQASSEADVGLQLSFDKQKSKIQIDVPVLPFPVKSKIPVASPVSGSPALKEISLRSKSIHEDSSSSWSASESFCAVAGAKANNPVSTQTTDATRKHVSEQSMLPRPTTPSTPLRSSAVSQLQSNAALAAKISAANGYSPNVPAPFTPLHGSPLRQALQNAASRANIQHQNPSAATSVTKAGDRTTVKTFANASEAQERAHALLTTSLRRPLTTSTLGNNGSLDSSPRSPIKANQSPVKYFIGRQNVSQCDSTDQSPRPARMVSSASEAIRTRQQTPGTVLIDDSSRFDTDSSSDSSSSSSNSDSQSESESEAEESNSRLEAVDSSLSNESSASVVIREDEASMTSDGTAPPEYTSALGQNVDNVACCSDSFRTSFDSESSLDDNDLLAPEEIGEDLRGVSPQSIPDEEPTIRHRGEVEIPAIVVHRDLQGECTSSVDVGASQRRQLVDAIVQTDGMEQHNVGLQMCKMLAQVQITLHTLKLQVAQMNKAEKMKHDHRDTIDKGAQENSMATEQDNSMSLCDDSTSVHRFIHATESTPNRYPPIQDVIKVSSPSAKSISTSRMAIREEVSFANSSGNPLLDSEFSSDSDNTQDESQDLQAMTLAHENLTREIQAMHSRSKSTSSQLGTNLDDIEEDSKMESKPSLVLSSPTASTGSILLSSTAPPAEIVGVTPSGQGLEYRLPSPPEQTSETFLKRSMSTLRKKRHNQGQQHGRSVSASSLFALAASTTTPSAKSKNFRPVTPASTGRSGLFKLFREGAASVHRSKE
ncbi:unnamed protein product [Sympodiomycopsis kandeliae]